MISSHEDVETRQTIPNNYKKVHPFILLLLLLPLVQSICTYLHATATWGHRSGADGNVSLCP